MVPLSNPFERINLARDATLRGDVAGVGRAVFDPKAVSPEERKSWVDKYLGGDAGPLAGILHLVTNPMVLAGLVLTMRYPVASAPRLLEFGQKAAAYLTKLPAWSAFFQDFHQIFAGTPLPRLFDYVVKTHHQTFSNFTQRYGGAIAEFEAEGGKYTKQVGIKIAAKLDKLDEPGHQVWEALREHIDDPKMLAKGGIPTIQLTPGEAKLAYRFRKLNDDLWEHVVSERRGDNMYAGEIAKALKADGFELPGGTVKKLGDYFPHIESLSREDLKARYQSWWSGVNKAMSDPAYENFQQMLKSKASKSAITREGLMIPDPQDLKVLGASDEALKLIETFDNRISPETGDLAGPTRKYSLNLLKTTENYARSMSRMKSWVIPAAPGLKSAGKLILEEYPKVAGANPVKAALLRDTYIPFARGQITQEAMASSLRFAETRDWAFEQLQKIPLPASIKSKLEAPLLKLQDVSRHSVGNTIADYFYTSALGGNITSAVKNLSQTLLTTYPAIGEEYTGVGIKEVFKRAPQYAAGIKAGLTEEQAFAKAFTEFAEHDFSPGGSASRSGLKDILSVEEGGIRLPSKVRNAKDKLQKGLLMPFQITEQFNRLVAFYGGRAKFLAEGVGSKFNDPVHGLEGIILKAGSRPMEYAASQFGIEIARLTQFGGGPMNAPAGIVKWWAPYRQFLSFPMRSAAFLGGYGVKLGGEGSFNPGTIGRAMLAAGVAYEGAKHALGADVSDALLFGALPMPRDRGSAGVIPLPPFLQVVGAGLSSAAKGDLEDIKAAAPLALPGGVGLSRAVTLLPGGAAAYINKPFADYDHPGPDGKIAVMTPTGQLQGYYSPTQLFARAIGFGDVQGSKERALRQYFMRQRDRIRGYRQEYINAWLANDLRRMQDVQSEWSQAYPSLGPIQVKKGDAKRVAEARDLPQLDRLLKTFPEQAKPLFSGIVAASMAADDEGLSSGRMLSPGGKATIPERHPMPGNSEASTGKIQQTSVEAGEDTRDDMAGNALSGFEGFIR